MASSSTDSAVATLVADTVSTVTVTGVTGRVNALIVTVLTTASGETITFAWATGGGTVANPTKEGDDLDVIPAVAGVQHVVPLGERNTGDITFKLISGGTPKVHCAAV